MMQKYEQSLNIELRINRKNRASKTLASFLSWKMKEEMEDNRHKCHLQLIKNK